MPTHFACVAFIDVKQTPLSVILAGRGSLHALRRSRTLHNSDDDSKNHISRVHCMQVLAILDGSAPSWPGVTSAVSDLELLLALAYKALSNGESRTGQLEGQVEAAQSKAASTSRSLEGEQVGTPSTHMTGKEVKHLCSTYLARIGMPLKEQQQH